tara:strand:+ start:480 stop:959 length:480 start_codon:yes stop_codon:yes gene_type:complete
MHYSKKMAQLLRYAQFLLAFFAAEAVSMWGQYFTLKFPNMTMMEALKKALPFAWLDWAIMTYAVGIGDKYKLVTPTQDTFLIIIVQFTVLLLINKFWLKQPVTRSDMVAFVTILVGFWVSFSRPLTKAMGLPIAAKNKRRKRHRGRKNLHKSKAEHAQA